MKKQCFTDAKKTNCLEAIKFVANLVWNGETNFAFLWISIVNTLLLRVPGEAGPPVSYTHLTLPTKRIV